MKKATPEQIRVFHHRRWMVVPSSIGILLLGFLLMVGLLNLDAVNKDGRVATTVCFGTVILTWLGTQIFQFVYFRCPVCGRPIRDVYAPRMVMLGTHCNHCDTDFAA
jgi:4-hydroxy-3-methylbut-2-en-1-yl diphosphate synthase IspG/GcpE